MKRLPGDGTGGESRGPEDLLTSRRVLLSCPFSQYRSLATCHRSGLVQSSNPN